MIVIYLIKNLVAKTDNYNSNIAIYIYYVRDLLFFYKINKEDVNYVHEVIKN